MEKKASVLVIGGGIAGIQASVDLADRGYRVHLVEKTPSIGGNMAMLDKTFPTMDCSICILAPKMIDCYRHPNINLLTYSELKEVEGSAGDFTAKILLKPRGVDPEKCIGCGACSKVCPTEAPNEYDQGLGKRKAAYIPFPQSIPSVYTIDFENCIHCGQCARTCPAKAIDLDDPGREVELKVGAIIVATGLTPFDPSGIKEYGYGKYQNVITALELERLVSATGPTTGHLVRPSDHSVPKKVAFIQCVGSRSLGEGYQYCSAVCCMHATKEAMLVKEHEPQTEVSIFYTDLRAFGKGFRELVNRVRDRYGIEYVRAKPSEIREDPQTGKLSFWYEDTTTGDMNEVEFDLVVLSTALTPNPGNPELAKILGVELDEYGFYKSQNPILAPLDTTREGIFICGYCQEPKDIPDSIADASGAAARAAEIVESVAIVEGSE